MNLNPLSFFFFTPPSLSPSLFSKNKTLQISLLLPQRVGLRERRPLPHMRAQARRGHQEPRRLSLGRGAHERLGVADDRPSQRRVLRHGEVEKSAATTPSFAFFIIVRVSPLFAGHQLSP